MRFFIPVLLILLLFTASKMKNYDTVAGIRAYNTNDRLKFYQKELRKYVKVGGTMVVQYNTAHALVTKDLGPYPLKLSGDRVTVEEAEVGMLKPDYPMPNFPNKITSEDFENWVQERGLLVAPYREGYYIYTGYSWFRKLPVGVPGAYRIFTNMISIGKD